MVDQARALVESQVRKVRIRLFLQVLVHRLVLCWAAGLLAAMLWFLVRPFAFAAADDAVRWAVPCGLMLLATIAGWMVAWWHRPDHVKSALALDEKFGLKERVTTFLTLADSQIDTPAGQALLKDVQTHLSRLHAASRFPLSLPWRQLLMPGGAFVLAAAAFLLDPVLTELRFTSSTIQADEPKRAVDFQELQHKVEELKKDVAERGLEKTPKSKELQALETELEKLLNQPIDMQNAEKVKEHVAEFRNLQDRMKDLADDLKGDLAKTDAFKTQLRNLDRDKLAKDGPAKDFEDALVKGDLDKAKKAIENLAKDMKDNKLDAKQQKHLADQLKNLQEQMKKVMDDDPFVNKLMKDFKEGKVKKEDLERELANFQNLQDLTKLVDDVQKALEAADGKDLGKEMEMLVKRFEEMEKPDREFDELMPSRQVADRALELFNDALGAGNGGRDGDGIGPRPIDPADPKGKSRAERSRAANDAKGVQRIAEYARGGTFNKIPAKAVEGAFRQAAQDAPEAIERQLIPPDAEDITRGYFKNLGKQ
jgi:hypothetical protein